MIIYRITNKKNGKLYIGQTVQRLEERWKQHTNSAGCRALSNAIRKYGTECFVVEKVDEAESMSELNKKESEWISKLNTVTPFGYNLNNGGENRLWSEESKKKMSLSHKGKKLSLEHKQSISRSVRDAVKQNPEKFQKGPKAMLAWYQNELKNGRHPKKGKKLSSQSRLNLSLSKMGKKNPMFGKKLGEEKKKELSQRMIGVFNKKILCHQNGKIYESVTHASKDLGFARSSVSNVLTGFRKNLRGYTFEYFKGDSNVKS